jgi:hypothetical protein
MTSEITASTDVEFEHLEVEYIAFLNALHGLGFE